MLSLVQLSCYLNHFSQSLPTEIGNLENLVILLTHNNHFVGSIPTEFGRLINLISVDMTGNNLVDCLPTQLGYLIAVQEIYLGNNFLSGSLPTCFSGLGNISSFDLGTNQLSGGIITELGMLGRLKMLSLSANSLSGTIPTELGNMSSLIQLQLSFNLLNGSVPSELQYLQLISLSLEWNDLGGPFPLLGQQLVELDLSDNFFTGSIGYILGNYTKLRILDAGSNCFSGSIPPAVANHSHLQSLNLSFNLLVGPIHTEDTSPAIHSLDLSHNYFSGPLPSLFFLSPALHTVIMSQNCFSGHIPPTVCYNHRLRNLVLDSLTENCGNLIPPALSNILEGYIPRRYMQGSIPTCIWEMTGLQVLHLQGNGLRGSLPELPNSSQLRIVVIGSNALTGTIPLSFQLRKFEQLDLSINRFGGTLSSELTVDAGMSTAYGLKVNRLSGGIPRALYQPFNSSVLDVLTGNLFGCDRGETPPDDIAHLSYSCGSGTMDSSLLLWIILFSAAFIGMVIIKSTQNYVLLSQSNKNSSIHEFLLLTVVSHASLAALCVVVALVGYLSFKLPAQWSAQYSTRLVQYWWTPSIAYLAGGPVVVFTMLLLTAASLLVPTLFLYLLEGLIRPYKRPDTTVNRLNILKSTASKAILHVINLFVILFVNAVYVLQAVNTLAGIRLLLIQAALSIFKLGWSQIGVPYLADKILVTKERLTHIVFVNAFIFIGAPFISTFCEAPSCFLEVIRKPSSVSSSFDVKSISCSVVCETHDGQSYCKEECAFSRSSAVEISILPLWLYSYECFSAVITTYSPVLLLSFTISGLLVPLFVFGYVHSKSGLGILYLPKWIKTLISLDRTMFCIEPATAMRLYTHRGGSGLQVGRALMVKTVLNLTVLMTFGLASPLLALAVAWEGFTAWVVCLTLMERFIRLCKAGGAKEDDVRRVLHASFTFTHTEIHTCLYVTMGFVGLFWCLTVFDKIGDKYGISAGAYFIIVPLVTPLAVCFCVISAVVRRQHKRQESLNIELCNVPNPLIVPQSTVDDFNVQDQQHAL
jgi:hypothetical protein